MAMAADDNAFSHVRPRTLAGATVLQIVPALLDTPQVRTTIDVAHALVRAGARAIVAARNGDLADVLKSFGAEWLPLETATFNPPKLVANAESLDRFIAAEGVHIVHARNVGAAWSASHMAGRHNIRLVTDIPDLTPTRMRLAAFCLGAIGHGDRIISHSLYEAQPMIARHRIPLDSISVIPRSIHLAHYNLSTVPPERVTMLRQAWGIPTGMRIVLTPGSMAPRNGQLMLVRTARILADDGARNITFVLAGDDRRHPLYVRKFWQQARAEGVDAVFRMIGNDIDMSEAYAAAHIVVLPYRSPPAYGNAVAEAQAVSRPVIATAVGAATEYMLASPHTPQELRTGWQMSPGDTATLATAISAVLALDDVGYYALAARARKFVEFKFSPEGIAAATLDAYTALLAATGR